MRYTSICTRLYFLAAGSSLFFVCVRASQQRMSFSDFVQKIDEVQRTNDLTALQEKFNEQGDAIPPMCRTELDFAFIEKSIRMTLATKDFIEDIKPSIAKLYVAKKLHPAQVVEITKKIKKVPPPPAESETMERALVPFEQQEPLMVPAVSTEPENPSSVATEFEEPPLGVVVEEPEEEELEEIAEHPIQGGQLVIKKRPYAGRLPLWEEKKRWEGEQPPIGEQEEAPIQNVAEIMHRLINAPINAGNKQYARWAAEQGLPPLTATTLHLYITQTIAAYAYGKQEGFSEYYVQHLKALTSVILMIRSYIPTIYTDLKAMWGNVGESTLFIKKDDAAETMTFLFCTTLACYDALVHGLCKMLQSIPKQSFFGRFLGSNEEYRTAQVVLAALAIPVAELIKTAQDILLHELAPEIQQKFKDRTLDITSIMPNLRKVGTEAKKPGYIYDGGFSFGQEKVDEFHRKLYPKILDELLSLTKMEERRKKQIMVDIQKILHPTPEQRKQDAEHMMERIDQAVRIGIKDIPKDKYILTINQLRAEFLSTYSKNEATWKLISQEQWEDCLQKLTEPELRWQLKSIVAEIQKKTVDWQEAMDLLRQLRKEGEEAVQTTDESSVEEASTFLFHLVSIKKGLQEASAWNKQYDEQLYHRALKNINIVLKGGEIMLLEGQYISCLNTVYDAFALLHELESKIDDGGIESLEGDIIVADLNNIKKLLSELKNSPCVSGPASPAVQGAISELDSLADLYQDELEKRTPVPPAPVQVPVVEKKPEPEVRPPVPPVAVVEPEKKKEEPEYGEPEEFVPLVSLAEKAEKEELPQIAKVDLEAQRLERIKEQREAIRQKLLSIEKEIASASSIPPASFRIFTARLDEIAKEVPILENDTFFSQLRASLAEKLAATVAQEKEKVTRATLQKLDDTSKIIAENARRLKDVSFAELSKQMLTIEHLKQLLTTYTSAKKDVASETFNEHEQRFIKALTDYCTQCITRIFFENEEYQRQYGCTMDTLRIAAHDTPHEIERWGKLPSTIMDGEAAPLLGDTFKTIKQAGIAIDNTEMVKLLAYLCASFDAFVSALYNGPQIMEKVGGNLDTYIGLLDTAIGDTFDYISQFTDLYTDIFGEEIMGEFGSQTFDVTQYIPELVAGENGYQYKMSADTVVQLGILSAKVPGELTAMHKKEYIRLLEGWKSSIQAQQGAQALSDEDITGLTVRELENKLKDLESIKESNEKLYNELKTKFDEQKKALEKACLTLSDIINTFRTKLTEAEEALGSENARVAIVNFDASYDQIQVLMAKFPALKGSCEQWAGNDNLDRKLIGPMHEYLTQCVNYVVEKKLNLLQLHTEVFERPFDVFSDIAQSTRAIDQMDGHTLQRMLNMLHKHGKLDVNMESARNLSHALMRGFCYILAVHDALEAQLSDMVDEKEKKKRVREIWKWISGLRPPEKLQVNGEPPYAWYDPLSKAMSVVLDMFNHELFALRDAYYKNYINLLYPEAPGADNINTIYLAQNLDVLHYIPDLKSGDDTYIYERPEIAYKNNYNEDFFIPAVTSKHSRFTNQGKEGWSRITQWEDYFKTLYSKDFDQKKVKEQVEIMLRMLKNRILDTLVGTSTLEKIHAGNEFIELLKTPEGRDKLQTVLTGIQGVLELLSTDVCKHFGEMKVSPKILHEPLRKVLALICANYDAVMFWVLSSMDDGKIKLSVFVQTLKNSMPLIIESIKTFEKNCLALLSQSDRERYNSRYFNVTDVISAYIQKGQGVAAARYRYEIQKKMEGDKIFIDSRHYRNYEDLVERLQNVLQGREEGRVEGGLKKIVIKSSLKPATTGAQGLRAPFSTTLPEEATGLEEPHRASPSMKLPTGTKIKGLQVPSFISFPKNFGSEELQE
jgi:hypothetical protein